jgi:hypothetical protein
VPWTQISTAYPPWPKPASRPIHQVRRKNNSARDGECPRKRLYRGRGATCHAHARWIFSLDAPFETCREHLLAPCRVDAITHAAPSRNTKRPLCPIGHPSPENSRSRGNLGGNEVHASSGLIASSARSTPRGRLNGGGTNRASASSRSLPAYCKIAGRLPRKALHRVKWWMCRPSLGYGAVGLVSYFFPWRRLRRSFPRPIISRPPIARAAGGRR